MRKGEEKKRKVVREKGRLGAARRILTPFGVLEFIAALDGKIYFLALGSPWLPPARIPPPPPTLPQ